MRFILLILLTFQTPTENYREIFDHNYDQATEYLKSIDLKSKDILSQFNANQDLIHAIVFPELMRYSTIRNYLETTSLELVYINTGLVDFSIGKFQIKPSFVEMVESYFLSNSAIFSNLSSIFEYASPNPIQIRKERLERLKSIDYQLKYLGAFSMIMKNKYPRMKKWDQETLVRFLSTAYNHDFEAEKDEIEEFMSKKFFPSGISKESKKYNYSDISWDYYKTITHSRK